MNGEIKIVKEATEKKAAEANRRRNKWFVIVGLRKEKVILIYDF